VRKICLLLPFEALSSMLQSHEQMQSSTPHHQPHHDRRTSLTLERAASEQLDRNRDADL